MKICMCGWYFYAPFLDVIRDSGIPAFVVKNREGNTRGIPSEMSEAMSPTGGRGLEFGAYQQYLMKHADGLSDVLFLQDDGEITIDALADIQDLTHRDLDQAFIFRDEWEESCNKGHSGRAFWMRANVVQKFKAAGGFEVDWDNCGNTEGMQANGMIHVFAKTMSTNTRCNWIAIVPGIQMGRRGWIPNKSYQFKRLPGQNGIVTPQSIL